MSKYIFCTDCKHYKTVVGNNGFTDYCKSNPGLELYYRYERTVYDKPQVKNKDNACHEYEPKLIKRIKSLVARSTEEE